MTTPPAEVLRRKARVIASLREDSWSPPSIATYLAVALSLATIAMSALAAAADHQAGLAAAWIITLLLPLGLAVRILFMAPPEPPPDTTYFRPFARLNSDHIWKRTAELTVLTSRLSSLERSEYFTTVSSHARDARACLVVGASGVGKSVLLRDILPGHLKRTAGKDFFYTDTYDTSLERKLSAATRTEGNIVVLDQFEQYLARRHRSSTTASAYRQKTFAELLRTLIVRRRMILIIAIRNEWHYDLRYLGDLIPTLSESVEITAPRSTSREPLHGQIVDQLTDALGLDDQRVATALVAECDHEGRLAPLEIQIVGAMLERASDRGDRVDRDYLLTTFGGVEGAVDQFFEEIIQGAPNRRVVLKVLCALSARTRFRQQESKPHLFEALFEPRSKVNEAIEYLVTQNLVIERNKRDELAHDYLAEIFHRKSASDLDPAERDNVEFHIEERLRTETPSPAAKKSIVRTLADRELAESHHGLAPVVLTLLGIVMTCRLFYFGLNWYATKSGPHPHPLIADKYFDETYLPIYVAHLSWAFYLGLFYHRIFRHLDESIPARLLSKATILLVPLCAAVSMALPDTWILSISLCGLIIGIKMMLLGRTDNVNAAARGRIRNMGDITTSNMVMGGLIGGVVLGMSIAFVHNEPGTQYWIIVMIAWSAILTVACFVLARAHIGHGAAGLTLGLLARPIHATHQPAQ